MCNEAKFPEYLSTGKLILLSKSETNFPKITDTRPLSIEPFLTKVIEKTLLNLLK